MQLMGQNPNAQAFQAAMQAHMAEHMAYSYRRALELKIGVSMPEDQQTPIPTEVQNDLAKLASAQQRRWSARYGTGRGGERKAGTNEVRDGKVEKRDRTDQRSVGERRASAAHAGTHRAQHELSVTASSVRTSV